MVEVPVWIIFLCAAIVIRCSMLELARLWRSVHFIEWQWRQAFVRIPGRMMMTFCQIGIILTMVFNILLAGFEVWLLTKFCL